MLRSTDGYGHKGNVSSCGQIGSAELAPLQHWLLTGTRPFGRYSQHFPAVEYGQCPTQGLPVYLTPPNPDRSHKLEQEAKGYVPFVLRGGESADYVRTHGQ
jgi:hypothetical protein